LNEFHRRRRSKKTGGRSREILPFSCQKLRLIKTPCIFNFKCLLS
jgi:hypothetical protein